MRACVSNAFRVLQCVYFCTYVTAQTVHREWDGSPIVLPYGGLTLDPKDMPALKRVASFNDSIITASGDTLLGNADTWEGATHKTPTPLSA
jgi:hypothetical protein